MERGVSLQLNLTVLASFYADRGMYPRFAGRIRYLHRGMILTVAARARLPIIGFKYGLSRYFVR